MSQYNICQTTRYDVTIHHAGQKVWGILDGQRAPAGYPASGAVFVVSGLTRAQADALVVQMNIDHEEFILN